MQLVSDSPDTPTNREQKPGAEATAAEFDSVAREKMLTSHLGLLHSLARSFTHYGTSQCTHEDLVSAGCLGLMSALDAFQRDRGIAFSTYAVPRIRGAMLDELRKGDGTSRASRAKSRALTSSRAALAQRLGREPQAREWAAELGVDVHTLLELQSGAAAVRFIPIGPDTDGAESATVVAELSSDPAAEMDERLSNEHQLEALRAALVDLDERERLVITLSYYEEMKLREIAAVLRVTESRVCQIRSSALTKLRGMLAPQRKLAA